MKKLKGASKVILVVVVAAGVVVIPLAIMHKASSYHSPTMFVMDTTLEITIQERDEARAEKDAEAALQMAREIESHTSRFKKNSDVYRINANAGIKPVAVHDDTLRIVKRSLEFSRLTDGAFDITVAPATEIWGFYEKRYRIPTKLEIDTVSVLVDYRKVVTDESSGTIMLAEPEMQIDLGGVAKGYAVDAMCDVLRERGVKKGLVNFGGTVGAIDGRADGSAWIVGIKSPRDGDGQLLGEIELDNFNVSSSGDYERYFTRGGRRYCHIFDPSTCLQPRESMSSTVVGSDAMNADILSTAVFVMGTKHGLALLDSLPGYEGLVVDGDGNIELSKNMKERYILEIKGHL